MKRFTKLVCIVAMLFFCLISNAQNSDTLEIQRNTKGKIQFARFNANPSSIRIMKNDTVFLRSILKAKNGDEFRLISENKDEIGVTHKKFQHFYKGLKVENEEVIIHGRNGNIEILNGDFQDVNISTVNPSLDERQALNRALDFVNSKKYKWEDTTMERFAKQNTNNPNATFFPKGELIISKDYLKGSNNLKLSWKFTISSMEPNYEQLIFVDANNGDIINNLPLVYDDGNTPGTAQTKYSGTQSITCDSYSGAYRLRESRNNVTIQTMNLSSTFNYGSATDFSNSGVTWTPSGWSSWTTDQQALDAHWGSEDVLDFWRTVFNRNSIDGNYLRVLSYVHAGANWSNGQWVSGTNNNYMQYGDGDGSTFKPFEALDVSAHEFGHGINDFTAHLVSGTQESGALNEGFSDIWGICTEHWAAPSKQTWLMGEEIVYPPYTCVRNIQNPKSSTTREGQHPDTYHGTYWDYGGEPHTNSTVLSHWFYLLSQGGSGTNDAGHAYNAFGISLEKAQQITYMTETSYLTSGADYNAVMNATISAATFLYPGNSMELMQVKNAWYAVGLGSQPTQMTITGNALLCTSGSPYTLNYPASGTLTWTCSSNILFVSGQGSNPCTFKAASNSNSSGWIQANINGTAGPIINIWVGTPQITDQHVDGGYYSPGMQICPGNHYLTVTPVGGNAGSATWTVPSGVPYSVGTNLLNFTFPSSFSSISITCRSTNSCGTGTNGSFYLSKKSYGCPAFLVMTVYPNPASDNANITLTYDPSTISTDSDAALNTSHGEPVNYTIKIYNSQSALVSSVTRSGKSFTVPLTNLRDGTYILEVTDGKTSYRQQLIVKHN